MSEINAATLNAGNTLQNGKYQIEKVLGVGGFGITYLASFVSLRKKVAVKEYFLSGCIRTQSNTVSPQSVAQNQFIDFKTRFLDEAANIASFDHKNIVRVTDIFEENNTAYFIMEFVEGKTLKQLVETNGKLTEQNALNIIRQIATALEVVHNQQMLHRDVKPDNIIIDKTGNAVLIDFGSARHFVAGKTVTQTAILTPGYAPIEQYSEKRKRGPFTDIYSLGTTLYFILTAQKPLPAPDRLAETIPEPQKLNFDVSDIVNSAILKAIELKPEDRFQSITEFLSALQGEYVPKAPEKKPETIDDKTLILNKDDDKTQLNQNFDREKIYEQETKTKFVPKHEPHHPIPPEAFDKKKSKKGWLIAIIAIVIIGLGAWYFVSASLNEQSYETALNSGNTKFEAKSFSQAINYYNEALGIKPNDPTATEKLNQANDSIERNYSNCIAQGDSNKAIPNYAEAKAAYTKALDWKPSDAIAQAKLKELDSLQAQEAAAKAKAEAEAKLLAEDELNAKKKAEEDIKLMEEDKKRRSGKLTDSRDGQTYKTIKIGNQIWMAENLNYATNKGSWCYDNIVSNCDIYGKLYKWETAKGACPLGWHLPSKYEFETLLSNFKSENDAYLKLIKNGNSGFNALLGGYTNTSMFDYKEYTGWYWSSTSDGSSSSCQLNMSSLHKKANLFNQASGLCISVRCIKD